jgi:hypothetical protein
VAVPPLTVEQHAAAVAKASAARRARFELKDRLKRGDITLLQVLDEAVTDDVIAHIRVSALLAALPGIGKIRAQKVMTELGIASIRRLRGLPDRQRHALLAKFDSTSGNR